MSCETLCRKLVRIIAEINPALLLCLKYCHLVEKEPVPLELKAFDQLLEGLKEIRF